MGGPWSHVCKHAARGAQPEPEGRGCGFRRRRRVRCARAHGGLGRRGTGAAWFCPQLQFLYPAALVRAVTKAGPALGDETPLHNNPTTCALSHFTDEVKKLAPSHVAAKWRHQDLPWTAGLLGLALWLAWQEVLGSDSYVLPLP